VNFDGAGAGEFADQPVGRSTDIHGENPRRDVEEERDRFEIARQRSLEQTAHGEFFVRRQPGIMAERIAAPP
jgi:hypothetical protein